MGAWPASPPVAHNVNHDILLVLCSPVSSNAAGSHHSFRIVSIHVQDRRPAQTRKEDDAPCTVQHVRCFLCSQSAVEQWDIVPLAKQASWEANPAEHVAQAQ